VMKEHRIKIAFEFIHESKKHLADLRNSAGPVTSKSLDKVQTFLTDLEKEVVSALPKEHWIKSCKLILALGLFLALDKLLLELVPKAMKVIQQLLLK